MLDSARQRRRTPAHPAINSSSVAGWCWYFARHRRFHCAFSPAHSSNPWVVVSESSGKSRNNRLGSTCTPPDSTSPKAFRTVLCIKAPNIQWRKKCSWSSTLPSNGHSLPPNRSIRVPSSNLRHRARRMKSRSHFGGNSCPNVCHTSGGCRGSCRRLCCIYSSIFRVTQLNTHLPNSGPAYCG